MKKPIGYFLLLIVLFLQAIGGLAGGFTMIISPSGSLMQFPKDTLAKSPFNNFLLPGIILFFLLGVIPLLTLYGLIKKTNWSLTEKLNLYKEQHWSWMFSIYTSVMLSIWLHIEAMFIGYDFLQTVYGLLSVSILVSALLPAVKKYYTK